MLLPIGAAFASLTVSVRSDAPAWRPNGGAVDILDEVASTEARLVLAPRSASMLLAELARGQRVTFVGCLADNPAADLRVAVNGIRFADAHLGYRRCEQALLPATFSRVERTRVQFEAGAAKLDPVAEADLDLVANYVTTDPAVAQVYVDGHTDDARWTRDNVTISQRRAQRVASYLEDAGLPAGRITVRYHGGKYPVASNENDAGRAMKRRATVRVVRNDIEVSAR
jgi:outer membrane protein OmpA-like peptidoglycan-associated protein